MAINGMNKQKIFIFISVILIGSYLLFSVLYLGNLFSFSDNYKKLENDYVSEIEKGIAEALELNKEEMIQQLETLREIYSFEIILQESGHTLYKSILLEDNSEFFDVINRNSVLFETKGFIDTEHGEYTIWYLVYQLPNSYYIQSFMSDQVFFVILLFIILVVLIALTQIVVIQPLWKISSSIKKANEFDFEAIQEDNDDNINRSFSQFVGKLKGTISAVSRRHTELEQQLQYTKERLNNTIVVSKALVHDLKTPIHQLLLENGYIIEQNPGLEERLRGRFEFNVEKTSAILQDINQILKMMSNDYNVVAEHEEFDVVSLIFETIKLFRHTFQEKRLFFSLEGEEEIIVDSNYVNMKLLIHNIISNACQYAKEDSDIIFNIDYNNEQLYLNCENWSRKDNILRMKNSEKLFNVIQQDNQHIYSSGNGLLLIKDLTLIFEGQYDLDIEEEKVNVNIFLPVRRIT